MEKWIDEIFKGQTRFGAQASQVLFEGKSKFQEVLVFENELLGRVLMLDRLFMTSERDEHLYHEMIAHPALVTAEKIRRVLIIGGGDGGTAREVLSYPEVEHVLLVEIDELVIDVSKRFLSSIGSAWDDPRLEVRVADAIEYVRTADVEPYDVILLDGSDPVGPAEGLFTEEFYRNAARLLAPRGVFALQSESPFFQRDTFLALTHTIGRVFPLVSPYFGHVPIYVSGFWSWTYASKGVLPSSVDENRAKRQEQRCKYWNRDIHRAAFAIPNDLKKSI